MSDRVKLEGGGVLFKKPGSPYWWGDFYDASGKRCRQSLKTADQARATKEIGKLMGQVDTGTFTAPTMKRLRVRDLLDMVERDLEAQGRRSLPRARRAITAIKGTAFANLKAMSVTTDTVKRYVIMRRHEYTEASVAYEVAMIRRGFTLAVQEGFPRAPKMPTLNPENARNVFFTREEFERLRAAISQVRGSGEMYYDLVTAGYYLGWRLQEVLSVRWDRFDMQAGTVALVVGTDAEGTQHHNKTDEGRVFHFTSVPELAAALQRRRAYTDMLEMMTGKRIPYVFHRRGRPLRSIREAWDVACEAAGFVKIEGRNGKQMNARRWHDFRRTAARANRRAGVPEEVAMKITGHKTRDIFRRYNIITTDDLADAGTMRAAYEQRQSVPVRSQQGHSGSSDGEAEQA